VPQRVQSCGEPGGVRTTGEWYHMGWGCLARFVHCNLFVSGRAVCCSADLGRAVGSLQVCKNTGE
jgi:hypothetical protein